MATYIIHDGVLIGKVDPGQVDGIDPSYRLVESSLTGDVSELSWDGQEVTLRDKTPMVTSFVAHVDLVEKPREDAPKIDYQQAYLMAETNVKVLIALMKVGFARLDGIADNLAKAEDDLREAMKPKPFVSMFDTPSPEVVK